MACETIKYPGRNVILEYAIGCGDKKPLAGEYKAFGSLRTKEFNLAWDSTDATDSDSIGALRENIATFQTLQISGDGVCRSSGALGENLIELTKHVVKPDATGGQPVVWLRMTFPDLTFEAFMLITTMSRSAPFDDLTTYSFEASATASDFGLIVTDTPGVDPVVSVTVAPSTAAISTPGGTQQLAATVLPATAGQGVTWVSGSPSIATVSSAGLVTAVADGSATITATSTADNTKLGTSTITVTGQ